MTKIDISNNKLCAAGGKALAGALTGNQVLAELNLAANSLGLVKEHGIQHSDMSGVIAISNTIPTMGALTSLNVSNSQLCGIRVGSDGREYGSYDASGLTALANAIGKHQ